MNSKRILTMKQFLALALAVFSIPAFSGNGSSGGGNIHGDQLNPWFLQNTKQVEYCVEISPDFSSLPRARILTLVEKSLSFWKKTFSEYSINFSLDFEFEAVVAGQTFNYTEACTDQTDLKFQLGFLTEEQKLELPNYKQLLGIAFRTSYDEQLLKGKGFIYIAPETGPLRPSSANLHPTPWSHKTNAGLEYMLIHELGHVFGLQDDHYSSSGIMSAKFAEMVTSKNVISQLNLKREIQVPSPFGCNKKFDGFFEMEIHTGEFPGTVVYPQREGLTEELKQILGLPRKFKANFKSTQGLLTIKVDKKIFGSVKLKDGGNIAGGQMDPAITVYLTRDQRVFKNLPKPAYNSHLEIYHVNKSITRRDEVLNLANGKELKVFIQYDQSCIPTIGTVHNGELHFDIFSGH